MRPIPGQPGFFGDFSTPPPLPPPSYTWDVPRGAPWTLGDLGNVASLREQLRANDLRIDAAKRALEPIIGRYPFDPSKYTSLAERVLANRNAIVRLSMEQFALLSRAMLSATTRNQTLVRGLLAGSPSPTQQSYAQRLLSTTKAALTDYDRILLAVQQGQRASRFVNLAGDPVVTPSIIVAGILAGTVVILVGGFLLYTLLASLQTATIAAREAERICELEQAAGRPCGGADWQRFVEQSRDDQRRLGLIPDINAVLKRGQNMLFAAGMVVIAGLLGYAAWTAEPARRQFAARFQGLAGSRADETLCDDKERRKKRFQDHLWSGDTGPAWDRERERLRAALDESEEACWRLLDRETRRGRK
ncbi:MAG: hypothetical protein ACRCSL_16820 [Microbacterium sp.]